MGAAATNPAEAGWVGASPLRTLAAMSKVVIVKPPGWSRARKLLVLSPVLLMALAWLLAFTLKPLAVFALFASALGVLAGACAVSTDPHRGAAANVFSGLVYLGFASMFVFVFGWGAIDQVRGMGG